MKKITILTPCFNEEGNVKKLYEEVKKVMNVSLVNYEYNHLFVDNCSTDNTLAILKKIASIDKNVKIIVNSRNFGPTRNFHNGIIQGDGDAVISMFADLQDPPEMIIKLVKKWEEGFDSVLAIKSNSDENKIMFKVRKLYYNLLSYLSEINIYKNFTGFGLYSRKVLNEIKKINDPNPFFRGIVSEVGYNIATIEYHQPRRYKNISKSTFYHLYDLGILGILSNSKIPLRIAVFVGALSSLFSFLIGLGYLFAKLFFWNQINLGIAPIIILVSFMFSVLLLFLGIIGEYIGAIYTQSLNRPLVHEKERINFD
jgi:glycosyltransferase involved in cell wall biosynthesis